MKTFKTIAIITVVILAGIFLNSIKEYNEYKKDFININGIATWYAGNQELKIDNEIESYLYYIFQENNKEVSDNITIDKDSLTLNTKLNHIEFKKINNNMYTHNDVNVYVDEQKQQYNIFSNNEQKEFNNINELVYALKSECNL